MAVEKQRHAHSSQQVTHKTQMRQSCFACFFYFPFKIRSLSAQRFFKAKHPTHCQAGQYLDRSKRGSHLSIARKDAPGPVLPPQIVPHASPRLVSVYKALQKSGHAPRLSCRRYRVHISQTANAQGPYLATASAGQVRTSVSHAKTRRDQYCRPRSCRTPALALSASTRPFRRAATRLASLADATTCTYGGFSGLSHTVVGNISALCTLAATGCQPGCGS
jgi:hypothetical protein